MRTLILTSVLVRGSVRSSVLQSFGDAATKQQPVEEPEMDEARGRAQPKRKPVTKFLMGMFPSDEVRSRARRSFLPL